MIFIVQWEINEEVPMEERLRVAGKLTQSGMFPPEGVEVLRFDITPDGWGITIYEAGRIEDVFAAVNMWRAVSPGFFSSTQVSPALPVAEAMPLHAQLLEKLAAIK
jgi:hypothetical protein